MTVAFLTTDVSFPADEAAKTPLFIVAMNNEIIGNIELATYSIYQGSFWGWSDQGRLFKNSN